MGEKSDGSVSISLIEMKWKEWREIKKEEREGKFWPTTMGHVSPALWGAHGPHGGREPLWPWGPRLTHGVGHTWPLGHLRPRALPHVLQPYLGHPNSDFESVFGLQTVTPSRTTPTTQL